MLAKNYSNPDPVLIERVRSATDNELLRYLENANRKLPDTRWLIDVITQEQIKRGGLRNLTAESVRQVILENARKGRTCTYKTIAAALGVSWEQAHWRLPRVLGQICEMENDVGRPMLTAIVTSQKGACGDGFFEIAIQLGHKVTIKADFQREEQRRVFEYWKNR